MRCSFLGQFQLLVNLSTRILHGNTTIVSHTPPTGLGSILRYSTGTLELSTPFLSTGWLPDYSGPTSKKTKLIPKQSILRVALNVAPVHCFELQHFRTTPVDASVLSPALFIMQATEANGIHHSCQICSLKAVKFSFSSSSLKKNASAGAGVSFTLSPKELCVYWTAGLSCFCSSIWRPSSTDS